MNIPLWAILVVIAQLLYAVVSLVDKYLVSNPALPRPAVYAFYVSMLSVVAAVVLPFGVVSVPSQTVFLHALISGIGYVGGILFLFTALKRADASDVVPVFGAATAVSSLVLRAWLVDSTFTISSFWGFGLLVIGTALISHYRFRWRGLISVLAAGVFMGASSVFVKLVFLETNFGDGFFWTRMANVLAGLALLLWPPVFEAVTRHERGAIKRASWVIIGNKTLAGIGFLLILIAINLGDVALVNALGGVQFVFLLIFAFLLSNRLPQFFKDAQSREGLIHKTIAIAAIVAGFFVLFL